MATDKTTVYEVITNRIIERIESEGVLPWRKPWIGGLPKNLISGKDYRGSNVWMLNMMPHSSPYWLTYKQAQTLGGNVRKGESGTPVTFWQFYEKKDEPNKRIPMIKYYTVFNLEQCDGIGAPIVEGNRMSPTESLEQCDAIISAMPKLPEIRHEQARAFYSPQFDYVNMPSKELFGCAEGYYHVLFHELAHATGHATRLNRLTSVEELGQFGSAPYAKEELVAELGASYLSGIAGIQLTQEDNSVAYLQGWLKALKNDPKLLIQASGQAQKAADYILRTTFDNKE